MYSSQPKDAMHFQKFYNVGPQIRDFGSQVRGTKKEFDQSFVPHTNVNRSYNIHWLMLYLREESTKFSITLDFFFFFFCGYQQAITLIPCKYNPNDQSIKYLARLKSRLYPVARSNQHQNCQQ